jgi:stage V sporulation protein AE
MPDKHVIIVTDGDQAALAAVETACANVHGRCISLSGGHQPHDGDLSADELVALIQSTPYDPVVVLCDDAGDILEGRGEKLIRALAAYEGIELIGAVAVASSAKGSKGVEVDLSVTRAGSVTHKAVNKEGIPVKGKQRGDTVSVLNDISLPIIVGLGDPGKMDWADDVRKGAPITTKALQLIMDHHAGRFRNG